LDFDPIKLEGRGDKVVRFDIPADAAAMATLRHSGSSNFAVWTVDESGNESDLLVNEIGKYSGQVLFDEREHSVAFSITASGSWAITISPIQKVPKWDTSEPRADSGDAVLRLIGTREPFSTISMTHRGDGNFAIWAYGESGTDLLVNEIGRYEGEALLGDAVLLEITANGAWSLAVNE
jgi:hypothetical protein